MFTILVSNVNKTTDLFNIWLIVLGLCSAYYVGWFIIIKLVWLAGVIIFKKIGNAKP